MGKLNDMANANDVGLERVEAIYNELDNYYVKTGLTQAADVSDDPVLLSQRLALYMTEIRKPKSPFRVVVNKSIIMYRQEHRGLRELDKVLLMRMIMDSRSKAANLLKLSISRICKKQIAILEARKAEENASVKPDPATAKLDKSIETANIAEEVETAEEILEKVEEEINAEKNI